MLIPLFLILFFLIMFLILIIHLKNQFFKLVNYYFFLFMVKMLIHFLVDLMVMIFMIFTSIYILNYTYYNNALYKSIIYVYINFNYSDYINTNLSVNYEFYGKFAD